VRSLERGGATGASHTRDEREVGGRVHCNSTFSCALATLHSVTFCLMMLRKITNYKVVVVATPS
jgi:hypothetical protein